MRLISIDSSSDDEDSIELLSDGKGTLIVASNEDQQANINGVWWSCDEDLNLIDRVVLQ